ncbi:phage tail protein [Bacillus sp. UFRGS-B20]|nr:phage tail protein [Bacillus sp. UFRGS-B20]
MLNKWLGSSYSLGVGENTIEWSGAFILETARWRYK